MLPLPTQGSQGLLPDEEQRLRALHELDIIDSPPELVFDSITALAAEMLDVPIALVSLVDSQRQWFKSHHGLDFTETPREWAFCAHAILGDTLLEVVDTRDDVRFANNPLVTEEPHIQFYAGMPLRTKEGYNLGTLCVLDRKPRQLADRQRNILARLAYVTTRAIEMRRATLELTRTSQSLKRQIAFNALPLAVNQSIAVASDEETLLQTICDLAMTHGFLRAACIAVPQADGRVQISVRSGEVDYFSGTEISVQDDTPFGQGPMGRVWRSGEPMFVGDAEQTLPIQDWVKRALQFNLRSIAVLPIRREGALWALFVAYHHKRFAFDVEQQVLLREVAFDVGQGLDRLALARRERDTAALLQLFMDNTPAAIVSMRGQKLAHVNASFARLFGDSEPADVLGPLSLEFGTDNTEPNSMQFSAAALLPGQTVRGLVQLRHRDDRLVLCEATASMVDVSDGRTVVWTLLDITERERLRQDLERSLTYTRSLMDNNAAGIYTVDLNHTIHDVNPTLCAMFGYSREQLLGCSTVILHPDTESFQRFNRAIAQSARLEHTFRHQSGTLLTCRVLSAPIVLPGGATGALRSIVDITELHVSRQRFAHEALHDRLTDLPNRRAFEQHLPRALARASRHGLFLAVGMIDLDDFKRVNDTHGHAAGDRLLQELAVRLRQRLRESDLLARLGGDEFLVVLEDLDPPTHFDQLNTALERLHQAVDTPLEVTPGIMVSVAMSMGLAVYPQDGTNSDSLLRQADERLYYSKSLKDSRVRWWESHADPSGADSVAMSESVTQNPEFPFSPRCTEVLKSVESCIQGVGERFVERFCNDLIHEGTVKEISQHLNAEQIRVLAKSMANHFDRLLDSHATRVDATSRAHRLGQMHAVMGLPSALLIRITGCWRQIFMGRLHGVAIMPRVRYQVTQVIEARLLFNLQLQAQTYDATQQDYHAVLQVPETIKLGPLWKDGLSCIVDRIGALPGISAAMVFRPDSDGVFQVEACSGKVACALASQLADKAYRIHQNDSPDAQCAVGRTWRRATRETVVDYGNDPSLRRWHKIMEDLGLRSQAAIPAVNREGRVVCVITLLGPFVAQFESRWMGQFLQLLQQRLSQLWQSCYSAHSLSPALDYEVSQAYRDRLFDGGLRVFVQPVIDLDSGALVHVEALARLSMPSGEMVAPAAFLPSLGESELGRLFRLVLDQSLAMVRTWKNQGEHWGIAVNMPPSTLRNPQCAQWVSQSLDSYKLSGQLLTLELLETEEIDETEYGQAVARLQAIGVRLAVDDLGSGYSSLKRLAELPSDSIKIDQSLTLSVRKSPLVILGLIRTLINLGKGLGRKVVVEGLEDMGMVEAVTVLGADQGQGFALARPMPAEDLLQWWQARKKHARSGEVRSYLGALARHWKATQAPVPHQASLKDCPVTHFLESHVPEDSSAAEWHARFHAGQDVVENSAKFIAWLVEKVKSETTR